MLILISICFHYFIMPRPRGGRGRGRGRGGGWRWALRRKGPGRPFGNLYLSEIPNAKQFRPVPMKNPQPIELTYPEYEVLRLTDLEKLKQEQVAKKMKTSRGTVWRLLESAREKVTKALAESRPLIISSKGEIKKMQ